MNRKTKNLNIYSPSIEYPPVINPDSNLEKRLQTSADKPRLGLVSGG